MTAANTTTYQDELKSLSNRELIDRCETTILSDSILSDAISRVKVDACYNEAVRRGNPDLYQRGYNRIAREFGEDLGRTDTEIPIDFRSDL